MLLYELGVDEAVRRRGVGRRLVEELASLARERGCHGMRVPLDMGNEAARATYARAGGKESAGVLVVDWDFRSA